MYTLFSNLPQLVSRPCQHHRVSVICQHITESHQGSFARELLMTLDGNFSFHNFSFKNEKVFQSSSIDTSL
jgi:hypothetical protein